MINYYKIAGVTFAIEGDKAADVDKLPGFKLFKCDASTAHFTINIVDKQSDFRKDNPVYTLSAQGVDYQMFKLDGVGYATMVNDSVNSANLTLVFFSQDRRVTICGDTDKYTLLYMLWIAYGLANVHSGMVAVHASTIVYNNRAVLFLGESGTGKSTHTRLWRENIDGAKLLNDDSPIVYYRQGRVFASGSPWSGKTPCFKQEEYELAAIVRLSQAPCNRIKRLNVLESFASLMPSCPPAFANDDELSEAMCEIISNILSVVPVYGLECLPDADAAELSCSTIFKQSKS